MSDIPASDPTPQTPRLLRGLAIGIILTVVVYAVVVLLSDVSAVGDAAQRVPPQTIVLAMLASTGNFILRGLRWDLYLRRVGIRIPWFDRWLVFLAGFGMSLTPGKVGELLKPALLHDRYKTPLEPVGSVVVAERITDLLAVAALLGIGAFAAPGVAKLALMVWLAVFGGLAVLASPSLAALVVRLVQRLPVVSKLGPLLQTVLESLRTLNQARTVIPALALATSAWFLQCLSLFIVASAMSEVDLTILESVLAYATPLLAGAAALVPGGVGVTEGTMIGLIMELGQAPTPSASAAMIIVRAVTLWWAVAVGLAALAVWTLRARSSSRETSPE